MNNGEVNYCRFLNGDDQGIVEIIKEYKDGLILFINSYVHNIHIAEELTEDVFFSLVVKKPKFTPKHSFKTWLFTIGRNRALNALRFHSKVITTDKADVLHLQKEELNIEKAYIKKEEQILLHQCILRFLKCYYRSNQWKTSAINLFCIHYFCFDARFKFVYVQFRT